MYVTKLLSWQGHTSTNSVNKDLSEQPALLVPSFCSSTSVCVDSLQHASWTGKCLYVLIVEGSTSLL